MSRSRRLGAATALPAAALAAALVLAPTTAFAADGDPAAVDGAASTGSVPAAEAAPTETGPATETPAADEPAAPAADTDEVVASDGDATGASGSSAGTDGDATGHDTTPVGVVPVETAAPAEVAPADEEPVADGPRVSSFDGAVRPGQGTDVYAEGFTPGDLVHVTVVGADPADDVVSPLRPRFDEDGLAQLTVLLPEDFPAGVVVTVTISDDHDRSASTDLEVLEFVPAPRLEVPDGATAGVVTVTGDGGIPGGYALVEVFDGDTPLTDQFTGDPAHDEQLGTEPAAPVDSPAIDVDVDPVPYETSGYASAAVSVDSSGRFSARFVLPAGDFATDAFTIDADLTNQSDFSGALAFSVAPAVTVPVATTPVSAAPTALPVRPVAAVTPARSSSLAYTGSDPSGALGWAAASVLAGAGALVAGRLRLRLRRR
ncbi:hypothetical protein [Frigoribacterium sp. Leaf186]|uniref:hypothetical protein n=1 Tax=Frigoribacterium sp. Leaf186 TaxID=1736293 RepID=UPI0006FA0D7F|nr:hypothetical protein [Frigoribacterium sp. Leaf186]KQS16370.1 hypothetical protein ASG05_11445 [Frigoribacterium sp. Leaf186]